MENTLIAAFIGAAATVFAAVLVPLLKWLLRSRKHNSQRAWPRDGDPVPAGSFEDALRSDSRVQRLTSNKNCRHTAEAALAYFVHNKPCPVDEWKRTRTWQQVEAVFRELSSGVRA